MKTWGRLSSLADAPWIPSAILLLSLAGWAPLARAQEKSVGGHIGFGFPLVTHDGGNVTTLGDSFQMSLPVGITVRGSGRMFFDFEFVPHVVDKPREITLTVNPGILWKLGRGWSAGCRVGFDINSSQFGPTPLVIKSWPIEHSFFNSYFVEADFVFRFNRPVVGPSTNPFTYNMVFGVGF
jgi:hypothetical protein